MALSKIDPAGLDIGQIGGRRNLIINGAMQVAQRGTSATTSAYNTVDRFRPYFSGVAVTTTQNALTSGSPYDEGHRYSMKLANTSTSSATSGFARIFQVIEAQNVSQSGWNYPSSSSYVTLSFWAKSSLAGTYYCSFLSNDGTARNYASSYTLEADTWKKVTITISGDANLTFNTDNGIGLYVYWVIDEGGDYSDSGFTLDQWGNLSSATFEVTGVQLEVGTVATPFEHRSYGEELALCQRYYYKHVDGSGQTISFACNYYSNTNAEMHVPFHVTMRAGPTLDMVTGSGYYRLYRLGGSDSVSGFTSGGMHSNLGYIYNNTEVSSTQGTGAHVQTSSTSAYLAFDAEL